MRRGTLDERKTKTKLEETLNLCSICLDVIESRTTETGEVVDLKCGHMFHKSCLKDWHQVKDACPNCNAQIRV